jgi:hypothetical protein
VAILSIGNKIREVLPKVQPVLEDMLDVELKDIVVKPFWKAYQEFSKIELNEKDFPGNSRYVAHTIAFPLFATIVLPLNEIFVFTGAGHSIIYYGINPINLLFASKKRIEHATAHELAHIAHRKLATQNSSLRKIPRYIIEGFAEHTARIAMSKIYHGEPEYKSGAYNRDVKKFREELQRRNYMEDKDLVKAIKELNQI